MILMLQKSFKCIDISKIDVLNQQESFKGEPKLFTH